MSKYQQVRFLEDGAGAITDVDFSGTAEKYHPDNPDAKYLYVYTFAREGKGEPQCFEIPDGPGGYGSAQISHC